MLRLALALLMLVMAPLFGTAPGIAPAIFSMAAFADDDGGDDDGGGGSGGGGGTAAGAVGDGATGGSGDGRDPSSRAIAAQRNCFLFFCPQPAPRVAAPRPEDREFVVWGTSTVRLEPIRRAGFRILAQTELEGGRGLALRLRAPARLSRPAALRRLQQAAPGAVIDRNILYRTFLRPAGRAEGAAVRRSVDDIVTCAEGVVVAIVDTAVDTDHPALRSAPITRLAMRAPDRAASGTRHGTAVASLLVGARDGVAPGLAPTVRLLAVDAFHRAGDGGDAIDTFDLARALDALTSRPVDVVNLSLTGSDSAVVAAALDALLARGTTIVAAAGNDGPRAKAQFPAAHPGVIAVAAIDRDGRPWRRSARGPHIAFAAEGVAVLSAGRGDRAESFTGTSFAAPVVTAMMAGAIRLSPSDEAAQARRRLERLAQDAGDPGRDAVFGHGIVRPRDACREPGPA